jgi:hypothetical protein
MLAKKNQIRPEMFYLISGVNGRNDGNKNVHDYAQKLVRLARLLAVIRWKVPRCIVPMAIKVGTIERVMINKRIGQVAYAVMSFGGFLGIGEDYYPLPWSLLTCNEKLGGYEVKDQLRRAPKYGTHETWDWSDTTIVIRYGSLSLPTGGLQRVVG